MPNNNMADSLARAAEVLAKKIRAKAPHQHLKDAVSVGGVTSPQPGRYEVEVKVTAKDALAWEYGSGVHNPKNPGTYEIRPKNKKALAFVWPNHTPDFPRGGKYIGPGRDDKLLFRFVDHPGVAARPYNTPAIEESLAEMRQIIGQAFAIEVKAELGRMFKVD